MSIKTFFIFLLISLSLSFFESNTPVILLDGDTFEKEVVQSKDIWLVLFYAPWCGHCKAFSPEYEKAAKALKGIFKIAAIDADKERAIGGKYNIQGFPTVKFFGIHKDKPVDYDKARTAEAVISFMFDKAKAIANARLNMKKSEQSNTNTNNNANQEKKQQQQQQKKAPEAGNEKDVIVLTDDNFDDMIFNDESMWLVAFYAPWCGHCKKLLPEWVSAATQLRGTIKLAKIDATENQKMAQRYQIQGYPTIKIFAPGKGKDKAVEEYQGPRDTAGIVQYALDKLDKFGYVPETKQLINSEILKEECESRIGICIIAFLPHIADSSAKERNRYLETINEAKKKNRGKPIYYLWAQGGDHFDFEEKLHLSFGYPAVIAVNYKKKMYSICRSSFSKENLVDFVSNLLNGREHLSKLPEGIKIKKVDKWDGNDYVPPKEDDDDL
jgi:protein disulfide-isomerase A6